MSPRARKKTGYAIFFAFSIAAGFAPDTVRDLIVLADLVVAAAIFVHLA
jgi:hypothetical protein